MLKVASIPSVARGLATLMLAALVGCRSGEAPEQGVISAPDGMPGPAWAVELDRASARIDARMPGRFGVYVKRLGAERPGTLDRGGDRRWYLSSTIKVPVAIAVLEQVDAGRIGLDQELVLRRSDFVDGAGDLLMHEPGTRFSIATLLEKSLRDSDSTATDMLIRTIGEEALNRRIEAWVGEGFGEVTSILDVRYRLYGPLHDGVDALSNMQILRLRNAGAGEPRLQALADALGVPRDELGEASFDEVFADYYRTGLNSATLRAYGRLLERLVSGELLSPASTGLLLSHMRAISTGDGRIQAGLPPGTDFAQKTGTQHARACNVGILDPGRGAGGAIVVAACAEDFGTLAQAERAFRSLGDALVDSGLVDSGLVR